jgi:hypothetical protein
MLNTGSSKQEDVSKERGVQIDSVGSKLYNFNDTGSCVLRLELPVYKDGAVEGLLYGR